MNFQYISGFLDADGSITLSKKRGKYYPRISFHNTCLEILVQIDKFIEDYLNIKSNLTKYLPQGKDRITQYTLNYDSMDAVYVLTTRLKLLHPKKYKRLLIVKKLLQIREKEGKESELDDLYQEFSKTK